MSGSIQKVQGFEGKVFVSGNRGKKRLNVSERLEIETKRYLGGGDLQRQGRSSKYRRIQDRTIQVRPLDQQTRRVDSIYEDAVEGSRSAVNGRLPGNSIRTQSIQTLIEQFHLDTNEDARQFLMDLEELPDEDVERTIGNVTLVLRRVEERAQSKDFFKELNTFPDREQRIEAISHAAKLPLVIGVTRIIDLVKKMATIPRADRGELVLQISICIRLGLEHNNLLFSLLSTNERSRALELLEVSKVVIDFPNMEQFNGALQLIDSYVWLRSRVGTVYDLIKLLKAMLKFSDITQRRDILQLISDNRLALRCSNNEEVINILEVMVTFPDREQRSEAINTIVTMVPLSIRIKNQTIVWYLKKMSAVPCISREFLCRLFAINHMINLTSNLPFLMPRDQKLKILELRPVCRIARRLPNMEQLNVAIQLIASNQQIMTKCRSFNDFVNILDMTVNFPGAALKESVLRLISSNELIVRKCNSAFQVGELLSVMKNFPDIEQMESVLQLILSTEWIFSKCRDGHQIGLILLALSKFPDEEQRNGIIEELSSQAMMRSRSTLGTEIALFLSGLVILTNVDQRRTFLRIFSRWSSAEMMSIFKQLKFISGEQQEIVIRLLACNEAVMSNCLDAKQVEVILSILVLFPEQEKKEALFRLLSSCNNGSEIADIISGLLSLTPSRFVGVFVNVLIKCKDGSQIRDLLEVLRLIEHDEQRRSFVRIMSVLVEGVEIEIATNLFILFKPVLSEILLHIDSERGVYINSDGKRDLGLNIQNLFTQNQELRVMVHRFLLKTLNEETDEKLARRISGLILRYRIKLLIGHHDELYDRAVEVWSASRPGDAQNPYRIFSKLRQYSKEFIPVASISFKEAVPYVLNTEAIKEKNRMFFNSAELPDDIRNINRDILITRVESLKARYEGLGMAAKEVFNRAVAEVSEGGTLNSLCDGLTSPYLVELVSIPFEERVSLDKAYFSAILRFVLLQPDDLPGQDGLLSLQEEVLLKMAASIRGCPTGQQEGMIIAYNILDHRYQLGRGRADLEIVTKAQDFTFGVVHGYIENLMSSESDLMRELVGVPTGLIEQLSHQSAYVKNLMRIIVGNPGSVITFDQFTGSLYGALVNRDPREVVEIFQKHISIDELVECLVRAFNRLDPNSDEQTAIYAAFSALLEEKGQRDFEYSDVWIRDDDTDVILGLRKEGALKILRAAGVIISHPDLEQSS